MEMLPTTSAAAVADAAYMAGGNGSFGESNVANGSDDQAGGVDVSTMDQLVNEQNDQNGGGVQFKKGPWTALEDAILTEHVNTHGEGNWNSVYRCTGLARCGKSCRLRWSNHLRPNLKKGAFSPEEERIIVESHALFGNKWARMAILLPGRTDNEIKNYWNTRVKRHQRLGIPLYPPHIQPAHHDPPAKRGSHRRGGHHHQCAPQVTSPPQSFTFQTQLPSPTTPTYNPLFNNPTSPISPLHSPLSSPTTPISKPLFPTSSSISPHHSPLPSPRATPLQLASSHSHHLHSPMASPRSSTTPPIPCSFTFQTQPLIINPPTNNHHLHNIPTTSTPTTPISSPSTTNTPTTTSLPLFSFSTPLRSPPTLVQSPLRFRRFPSFSLSPITTNTTTTTTIPFALPMQRFSRSSTPTEASTTASVSPHHEMLANHASSSSSAFQREMEEENNRLCLLLADITRHQQQRHQLEQQQQQQQQLPSIQFLPPRNHNVGFLQQLDPTSSTQFVSQQPMRPHFDHQNVGILRQLEAPPTHFMATSSTANATTSTASPPSPNFDRRGASKRKSRDGEEDDGFLFMEDDGDQGWSGKTGHFVIDQEDQDKGLFDGLPETWNHFDSFSQCPGMGPNGESTSELNITIPEDLASLVNSMTSPTDPSTHSNAGGGTSDDRSLAVTGEKTDVIEMHQIASLFSSSADHDRAALDNCSWENLSEICR